MCPVARIAVELSGFVGVGDYGLGLSTLGFRVRRVARDLAGRAQFKPVEKGLDYSQKPLCAC